jgi:hypothetical protein
VTPEQLRYAFFLCVALLAAWYFSRVVWIGFTTGRVIDSRPWDGVPVTRRDKPIVFWFSMIGSALFVPSFVWLAVNLSGQLLGLWEFRF